MLKTSFSTKIALFTCFFVLLTGVVVAFSFSVESQQALIQQNQDAISGHLEDKGGIVESNINNTRYDIQLLSKIDLITQLSKQGVNNPLASKRFLSSFLAQKPFYTSISLYRTHGSGIQYKLNDKGQLIWSKFPGGIPSELLLDEEDIRFLPIESHHPHFSNSHLAIMGVVAPIYRGKKQTAAVRINLNFSRILSEFYRHAKHPEYYVTDSTGILLGHPDDRISISMTAEYSKIQDVFPVLNKIFQGENVSGGRLPMFRGYREYQIFYKRIAIGEANDRALYFFYFVPHEDITEKPQSILLRSILLTFVMLVFSFMLVVLFSKTASQDILKVAGAIEGFLQAKATKNLPLHRQDEIGKLARMFDRMAKEYGVKSRELADSEARYRKIVETAEEGVVIIDQDYCSQFVNQRLAEMLGYKVEELVGHSIYEFVDAAAHSVLLTNLAGNDKSTEQFDIRLTRKDGAILWCLVNISFLKDDHGRDMGMLAMVNDISNRKMAEQALQHSQLRFQSLFEDAPIPLWETNFSELQKYLQALQEQGVGDLAEYLLHNSEAIQKLFGKIQILAMNSAALTIFQVESIEDFRSMLPFMLRGDDLKTVVRALVKICIEGKDIQDECKFYTMGDEALYIRFRIIIPPDSTDCSRILTGAVDISNRIRAEQALRESEQRYALIANEQRILLEHTQDFVYRRDSQGVFTYLSPAVKTITGMDPDEMDQPFHHYLTDNVLNNEFLNYYRRSRLNSDKENLFRLEMKTKMGNRVLEVNERPFIEDGELKYFVGVARDISLRYGMELQIKHSQEELRELAGHLHSAREEEQTRIAREIHDEFGQVLMALNMDIHWLKRHTPDDVKFKNKIRSMVDLINIATNTVQRLLNDLRPIILDDLGLPQALDWYVEEFSSRTHIKCSMKNGLSDEKFDKEFSTTVFRLVQEALTNIAKHAQAKHVDIELMEDRSNLSIQIKDDGVGMPEKTRQTGKSFGLIGMRERTMGMGGIVKITSEPGKGTLVWISLPMSRARIPIPA